MSSFWKARLATFAWGFGVSWWFTGEIILASKMFLVMALGNTVLMWFFIK